MIDNGHLLTKLIDRVHVYAHTAAAAKRSTSLLTAYTVNGTIALLYEWFKNPSLYSSEEITKLILALGIHAEKLS